MRRSPVRLLASVGLAAALAGSPASAAEHRATTYPMDASQWTPLPPIGWASATQASLRFARYEGLPTGTMTVNEGVAASTGAHFSSGTIDFDIKPLGYGDTGIIFRRQSNESGEFVYLRANPDCPAADDCIQYAPVSHGLMQWDIYSDDQGPAPIAPAGWNHVRLLVAGQQMLVYVNRQAEPSLVVPELQGLTTDGGIAFKGPAVYANLVIRPGAPDMPSAPHRVSPDTAAITHWLAAPPSSRAADRAVPAAAIPPPNAWRPIAAEPTGLVNLSRSFGAGLAPAVSVGWLKAIIAAAAPTRRTMRLGWARQITVFLNGQAIFSSDNPYYPPEKRLSPNGRLEADNAAIPLDLHPGNNEIVLAVGNSWRTASGTEKPSPYGWAAEAHLDPAAGIEPR